MVMKSINYAWTSEVSDMYICFDSTYSEFNTTSPFLSQRSVYFRCIWLIFGASLRKYAVKYKLKSIF